MKIFGKEIEIKNVEAKADTTGKQGQTEEVETKASIKEDYRKKMKDFLASEKEEKRVEEIKKDLLKLSPAGQSAIREFLINELKKNLPKKAEQAAQEEVKEEEPKEEEVPAEPEQIEPAEEPEKKQVKIKK